MERRPSISSVFTVRVSAPVREPRMPSLNSDKKSWWMLCLCAEWCNVCRALRPEFESLATDWPHIRFAWVDVEDEEALVVELEIETFPTLLIGDADEVRFLGPVQPRAQVLARLLAGLTSGDGVALDDSLALAALKAVIQSRG